MSLLSKLFGGDKEAEKTAKELFGAIFSNAAQQKPEQQNANQTSNGASAETQADSRPASYSRSGYSWGDEMPAEENQYNFGGGFSDYFESVFRSELPEFSFEKSTIGDGKRRYIYTFSDGVSKKLVVELMPETSSARKLRDDCRKQGVPYLRFYYNHAGWWNTRKYVAERLHKAVG